MPSDFRGLELTTRSAGAADRYNAAVQHYLDFRPELMDSAREAVSFDPRFVMGNVLLGILFRLGENDAMVPRAKQYLASAQAFAAHATPREQAHVEALER